MLDRLKPFLEGGPGFIVFDAHLGIARRMWLGLTWLLEDIRGLPQPTGSKTAPAYVGACAFCEVRGIRHGKTSVYMSAIAHTRTAAIKALFALEHAASPDLLALAAAPPPARNDVCQSNCLCTTRARRRSGGRRALQEPEPLPRCPRCGLGLPQVRTRPSEKWFYHLFCAFNSLYRTIFHLFCV